jgi:hypothetical protein
LDKLDKLLNKIKNAIVYSLMVYFEVKHEYDPKEFAPKDDEIEIIDVKIERQMSHEVSNENSIVIGDATEMQNSGVSERKGGSFNRSLSSTTKADVKHIMTDRKISN